MGACASMPVKERDAATLPPLPAKEESVAVAGMGTEKEEKKEVVEETKLGPSLGTLLDEDEKKIEAEAAAAKELKKGEAPVPTLAPAAETKPVAAEEVDRKAPEEKEESNK